MNDVLDMLNSLNGLAVIMAMAQCSTKTFKVTAKGLTERMSQY